MPNPPWVTQLIADNFTTLQAKVLPAYMPVLTDARARRDDLVVEVVELGCGAYGCVLPTDDKDVVLKITTDDTEFLFVSQILRGRPAPEGLVRYYAWAELGSAVVEKRERNAYALWRESATDIGDLGEKLLEDARARGVGRGVALRALDLLTEQQRAATRAYAMLALSPDPNGLYMEAINYVDAPVPAPLALAMAATPIALAKEKPAPRALAMLLGYFRACATALGAPGELALVAKTLLELFEGGILVADVHTENVGRVMRDRERRWVITDPGNVAVLPQPWPRR